MSSVGNALATVAGAVIGTVVGGPVGMMIGAGVGSAATGGFSGGGQAAQSPSIITPRVNRSVSDALIARQGAAMNKKTGSRGAEASATGSKTKLGA